MPTYNLDGSIRKNSAKAKPKCKGRKSGPNKKKSVYKKKKNNKNKTGQPEFIPTPEQRQMICVLGAAGFSQDDMCKLIPAVKGSSDYINVTTLRKYFRYELDTGKVKANAKIAAVMYNMASSGHNTAASIFYCRTQLKYNTRVEIANPDGSSIFSFGDILKAGLISAGALKDDDDEDDTSEGDE